MKKTDIKRICPKCEELYTNRIRKYCSECKEQLKEVTDSTYCYNPMSGIAMMKFRLEE